MSSSTAWNRAGVIARYVGILVTIALVFAGTAWALQARVTKNTADIKAIQDVQREMRQEVRDLWLHLLKDSERSKKE